MKQSERKISVQGSYTFLDQKIQGLFKDFPEPYFKNSRTSVHSKIKVFQGPKTNFKYFQGLEIGLLKFKGFQDAYEPCQ